ncbi:hypothetical protein ACF07D_03785 [Leucobacter sp. NPDC015123]|uniref:hypothetical protein n=1 Tax=Leucobacter sp. NPDC015123 TaxID=3364129 RepID=UPI0036F48D0B
MDEIDVLRSMRSSSGEPEPEALIRGQARLERAITERGIKSKPPQRRAVGRRAPKFVLAGVAAAAAIGIGVTALWPSPNAPAAQASAVLADAADQVRTGGHTISAGELLRIQETDETLGEVYPAGAAIETPGETIKYRAVETVVTLVPSDPEGDWIVRRSGRQLVEILDDLGNPNAEEAVRQDLAHGPGASEEVWPAGVMPGGDSSPLRTDAPTEKSALRGFILSDTARQESDESDRIFEWLLPVLSNPAASVELRAAGFEVLADLGTLTAEPAAQSRGSQVVSLSTPDGEARQDLVFNDRSELVQVRTILTGKSSWFPSLAPGTVLSSTTTEASVVKG